MNETDRLKNAPVNKPIYLIDHQHNLYVGTLLSNTKDGQRGECLTGDPELFYRNAIVDWAYIRK